MKTFKSVEETRRAYHSDGRRDSVHRSSLTVPELPGAEAEISFVNHFLLKRDLANVACRITAVDGDGARIGARYESITEPRVYTLPLTGTAEADAVTYLVEFFAADNLFIPFPAVMVNHRAKNFLNTVHSYNRVLNDVFEDDAINSQQAGEAAIDFHGTGDRDAFVLFAAGPRPCRGTVEVSLVAGADERTEQVAVDLPRLGHHTISLGALFPDVARDDAVVRVRPPRQDMFYGRMLVGARDRDGAFSANHSYYDTSGSSEYWDDGRPSRRIYPLFAALEQRIRFHPTMAPGTLAISLAFRDAGGRVMAEAGCGEIASPGGAVLDIDVNETIAARGLALAEVNAFEVIATPAGGTTPSRIAHQLVHRSGTGLPASVVVGLINPNVFQPEGKRGLCWGQLPLADDLESWLGISPSVSDDAARDIEVAFYGDAGEIARRRWTLAPGAGLSVNAAEALAPELAAVDRPSNIWFMAHGPDRNLTAYSVTRHAVSNHCTGEHSF